MAYDAHVGGTRRTVAGEAGELNVLEAGDAGPVTVFVHGFPDTHSVWLTTIARLAGELRCVAYDVRGAGGSTAPATQDGYQVAHLVDDLVAVIDAASPSRPVHLVGHDWGSVQAWEAVLLAGSDPRLRGRLASYTSISGPSLGHFGRWARRSRHGSWRERRALARQLRHSWYLFAFQVPRLPELALRRMLGSPEAARRWLGLRHAAPTVAQDAVNGLGLYRANLHHQVRDRRTLRTDLPIQLIVPLRDRYLTPAVYDDLPRYCRDLTRHEIDAGHWVQQSHPDQVAAHIAAFVHAHESAPPSP